MYCGEKIKLVWSWWWRKHNLFLLGCFPAYLLDKFSALLIGWKTGKRICHIICLEKCWWKKKKKKVKIRQGRKWWGFHLAGPWNCTDTSCSFYFQIGHQFLLFQSEPPLFPIWDINFHLNSVFMPGLLPYPQDLRFLCCWGLAQLADFFAFEEFHEQTPSFPLYLTLISSFQRCGRGWNPSQEEEEWRGSALCTEEPGEIWRSGEGKYAGMSRSL